jgi:DNA-binding transcriptional ArsR family regulator
MKKSSRFKNNSSKNNITKKELAMIPSIIPTKIFENQELSDGAKVFYGALIFLARPNGYAFAGTRTLATYLGRSPRSILYYIAELKNKNLIDVVFENKKRLIYPVIPALTNIDVAVFVPPEILCQSKLSSGLKLSYGAIQYRSANQNGYYAYQSVDELADMTGKSRSTIYRHLKIYKKLKLARFEKDNDYTRIYTFNTYQDNIIFNQNELEIQHNADPPKTEKLLSITPEEANYLRGLIGRT